MRVGSWQTSLKQLLLAALCFGVASCAEAPKDPEELAEFKAVNDPLEPMNRAVFDFNMAVDKVLLRPIAKAYRAGMPETGQRGVHNAVTNLKAPMVFVNDVLQGEPDRATQTMVRFLINSTVGLGGLIDVIASTGGAKAHDSDFGQTLGVWGMGEGPYLMLPFFGPSNPRDTAGRGVEFFADPTDWTLKQNNLDAWSWVRMGVETIDERAGLLDPMDDLERSSLDFYATIRSIYRQRRANLIRHNDVPLDQQMKAAKP